VDTKNKCFRDFMMVSKGCTAICKLKKSWSRNILWYINLNSFRMSWAACRISWKMWIHQVVGSAINFSVRGIGYLLLVVISVVVFLYSMELKFIIIYQIRPSVHYNSLKFCIILKIWYQFKKMLYWFSNK